MVDPDNPIERVPVQATRKISAGVEEGALPATPGETGGFEAAMQRANAPASSQRINPFDLVTQQSQLATGPTFDGLLAQIGSTEKTSKNLQELLATPNLKLKQSQKYLIENKLTDALEQVRGAGNIVGATLPPGVEGVAAANPIVKFLSLLTNGEKDMAAVKDKISTLRANNNEVNPADFLLLQMKMGKAQHQLEYASMLLAKAVEGLKTMMQINL